MKALRKIRRTTFAHTGAEVAVIRIMRAQSSRPSIPRPAPKSQPPRALEAPSVAPPPPPSSVKVVASYKSEPPVIRERVPTMDFELEDDDIVEAELVTKKSAPPPPPPASTRRPAIAPAPVSMVRPVIPAAAPLPSEFVALASAPKASEFLALAAPPPPVAVPIANTPVTLTPIAPAPASLTPPPPPPALGKVAPVTALRPIAQAAPRSASVAPVALVPPPPPAPVSFAPVPPPPSASVPPPSHFPAPIQSEIVPAPASRISLTDPTDLLFDGMYDLNFATSAWEAAGVCATALAKALGARSVVIHAHDLSRREVKAIGAHGEGDVDVIGLSEPSEDDLVASAVICNQKSVTMTFDGELPGIAPKRLRAIRAPRTLVAVPAMAWGRCLAIIEVIDADERYATRVADSASYVAERFAEFLSAHAA